jgi:hydrogenase small subunit
MDDAGLYAALIARGMTRRSFLKFSTAMAAALALPASYAPRIAVAVAAAPRLPVIWIRAQTCGGNTEALLRAPEPTVATLLLETLSVEYHESLLATAGAGTELALTNAMARYPNGYVAVLEGAIPAGAGGGYCLVNGRPVADVAREVCDGALATIAVGACAFDGGAPAASGGQTDAGGVKRVVGNGKLITLPGCPMNVVYLTAVLVHYLTFKEWPALDPMGRPLAAYGNLIHNQCERRPHFEFGEFALTWGDEGAQRGWCLYKLGCKGPETMANCPTVGYGGGVSWNVRAGHGCVGCVMPAFWNQMGPAYKRLPSPIAFFPNLTVDELGAAAVVGVAAVAGVHAVGMGARYKRRAAIEGREVAGTIDGTPDIAPDAADEPDAGHEPDASHEPGGAAGSDPDTAPGDAPAVTEEP